jgi:hypothetical protein
MKEPTPANIKALDALVKQWMASCVPGAGGSVVRYGQGAAVTKKPSDLGCVGAAWCNLLPAAVPSTTLHTCRAAAVHDLGLQP